MRNLILIGLGGFLGAILRFSVSDLVQQWFKSVHFPYGTLVVNLLGCFLLGGLSHAAELKGLMSTEARAFMFIGLLGAFTTFSAFGNDTVSLIRKGEDILSLLNIGLNLGLGLTAVWLGQTLVSLTGK
jgi:CrcB protein